MPYSQQTITVANSTTNNGYGWCRCHCCPYGYHIDLDFVRYCESISEEVDRSGSIKRRKDRRRQRHSMEVLLGVTPPVTATVEQNYKTIQEVESPDSVVPSKYLSRWQDSFDNAVSDFENTLQKSKKSYNNLPDVTAVSESPGLSPSMLSITSMSGPRSVAMSPSSTGDNTSRDLETLELCGLSPAALQKIREQMALSLERTKELEDQVKLIPTLKTQLSVLKEEKRQLLLKIQAEETEKQNRINENYIQQSPNHLQNSRETNFNTLAGKTPTRPPSKRDFGVMCGALTRNVGVGHQYPHTKTVSTATVNGEEKHGYTDKWFSEKIKFLSRQSENANGNEPELNAEQNTFQKTETISSPKITAEAASQTTQPKQKVSSDSFSQTVEVKKQFQHVGISVKLSNLNCATQTPSVNVHSVAVQIDTPCLKCNKAKVSVGVGPENKVDSHVCPVSLASLAVPRSKSFNLDGEKLNLRLKNRTVGCQYESSANTIACQTEKKTAASKACQNGVKTSHRGVQYENHHEVKTSHRGVQYENNSVSKITDTKDLTPTASQSVACQAKEVKNTAEFGCNTAHVPEKTLCTKCSNKERDDLIKKESSPTPSRIPRPQPPLTPIENRKFRRQDTYTKIPGSPEKLAVDISGLSGLELPRSTGEPVISQEKVTDKLEEVPSHPVQNGAGVSSSKVEPPEVTLPVTESTLHLIAQKQRHKAVPSKEMQAAIKVINDSLQKSHNKNLKYQLKNATNIVQQEWFKISSLVNANPLDVEDYLDAFEDVSSAVLEYIVNMIDASGNTAMHYAVSHGNFDVVSILLDSKVCDINKPNKAGYTSVMLVSLAEVRSQTHASVVCRLFKLADVNIRAKQHGQTALMLAVSHGRLDMVKMLLEAGADINIQDEDGSTALMCAAEHGHVDIVQHFLSQSDCDSTITDTDGSTALKIAMEAGHRHIGVLLYAHERNLHGSKLKKSKSTSSSPKSPASPLPFRSTRCALSDNKPTK